LTDSLMVFEVTIPKRGGKVASELVHCKLLHKIPLLEMFLIYSAARGLDCRMTSST
jgi:hypothetical protein